MFVPYFIGTAQEFKKKFETPILRGRDADASDKVKEKGQEKLQEVNEKRDNSNSSLNHVTAVAHCGVCTLQATVNGVEEKFYNQIRLHYLSRNYQFNS